MQTNVHTIFIGDTFWNIYHIIMYKCIYTSYGMQLIGTLFNIWKWIALGFLLLAEKEKFGPSEKLKWKWKLNGGGKLKWISQVMVKCANEYYKFQCTPENTIPFTAKYNVDIFVALFIFYIATVSVHNWCLIVPRRYTYCLFMMHVIQSTW